MLLLSHLPTQTPQFVVHYFAEKENNVIASLYQRETNVIRNEMIFSFIEFELDVQII
jgi:hypothetical protein